MGFCFYNPNPARKRVGDCVVRAISNALDLDWETAYTGVCLKGFEMHDMPSSNAVWGEFLRSKGFKRYIVSDTTPYEYTVEQFCVDNPVGVYILATGSHVIAVRDGSYYDTWDSGDEVPVYFWRREIQ